MRIDESSKIAQVEKIQIPHSPILEKICKEIKELKNSALYISRQIYFLLYGTKTKDIYDLEGRKPDLAQDIRDAVQIRYKKQKNPPFNYSQLLDQKLKNPFLKLDTRKKRYLMKVCSGYQTFELVLRVKPVYDQVKIYSSYLPQQTLRIVADMWFSYFESFDAYQDDPSKFEAQPQIPAYNHKKLMFQSYFPDRAFNGKALKEHYKRTYDGSSGELFLPFKLNSFPEIRGKYPQQTFNLKEILADGRSKKKKRKIVVRTTIHPDEIIGLRVLPIGPKFEVQVLYKKPFIKNPILDPKKVISIDIGLNIQMAMVTNLLQFPEIRKLQNLHWFNPILIRGGKVKLANDNMNTAIKKRRSIQTKGLNIQQIKDLPYTKEMKKILLKRHNIIYDQFHKSTRFVIEYCQKWGIASIVIGYNKGWKQKVQMERRINRRFVQVPLLLLIEMLKYKAELEGIEVCILREEHTSKCSALDKEPIGHHKRCMGTRGPSIWDNRLKNNSYRARGLFKSAQGKYIHSDVNGAYNIGRLKFPKIFDNISESDMLRSPIAININWSKTKISSKLVRSIS